MTFRESVAEAAQPHQVVTKAGFTRLSALEWLVVALARQDHLSILPSAGRLARAMGSVFGGWPDCQQADDRLEVLRRMAMLNWHSPVPVSSDELDSFTAAGFSIDQYSLVQASISHARSMAERIIR